MDKTYRGYASWIRLDARNARSLGLANHLRRDILMQIERHEVVDIRLDGSQPVTVRKRGLHRCDRWDEVGLRRESTTTPSRMQVGRRCPTVGT